MRKIEVFMEASCTTVLECSKLVLVPDDVSDEELEELGEEVYGLTDGGDFQEVGGDWHCAATTVSPAPGSDPPELIACVDGDGNWIIQEFDKPEPPSTSGPASTEMEKGQGATYVDIAICLFFLPEIELQEYDLTGAGLRRYTADLDQRLSAVADLVDKLRDDGWSMKVVANNLEARHPEVRTYMEAVGRLKQLHIEEGAITDIAEWTEEGKRLSPV